MISSPPLAASTISRDLELEALQVAVRWPNPAPAAILALAGRFAARGRYQDGFAYFQERALADPGQALFGALEAQFQLRLLNSVAPAEQSEWLVSAVRKLDQAVDQAPGIAMFLRGAAFAELPASAGKAEVARADLERVLGNSDVTPLSLRRATYRALARAYANLGMVGEAQAALQRSGYPSLDSELPTIVTEFTLTRQDGFRFVQPRLVELAPRVHVAQGFDFGDFAFVVTTDRIVAIDAGTSPTHARAALEELRQVSDLPITDVIVTHSHWDHIGGLSALLESGTRVIAQAQFAEELRTVNETGVPFRTFFGPEGKTRFQLQPDYVVRDVETLVIGGTDFCLYPVRGGETRDALLIHLPSSGVMFTGDAFMPFLGAPFLAEGSAEGLFDAMDLIQRISPRMLVHGHAPLTEQFSAQILPTLAAALRELYGNVLDGLHGAETLAQILGRNVLPEVLRSNPASVMPYLLMRENLVKRVYHQRSGYWKPDGEGMEVVSADEWAAAVALLGDDRLEPFVMSVRALLDQHDAALALRMSDLGLRRFPDSSVLVQLRQQALQQLRALNQQIHPFKFIVYSEWAQSELAPIE